MSASTTINQDIEILLQAKCQASLDDGILTLEDGTQIDLRRLGQDIRVYHWNSEAYGNDKPRQDAFDMSIDDQRASNGQLYVNFYGTRDTDDAEYHRKQLGVTAEINDLEGVGENLPCLHVHFNDSELAFSCFKLGNSIYLRPETGVTLIPCRNEPDALIEVS